jgi:hypothetical protein
MRSTSGILAAATLLVALVAATAASATPVQEFSFQVKDVTSGGRFTVAYRQRSYDTTGAVPESPNEFFLRLPAGLEIRRQFLSKRILCNTKKLDRTRNPATCRRSQVGTGRVLVDARPFIADLIPADLWLFLAQGKSRRAVASLAILGKQDQSAPVVRDIPVVRDFRAPIVFMDVLDDPTPDGKYGYKLKFAGGGGGGAAFSIAETTIENKGFSITRRHRKLFWLAPPRCPSSGKVSFQAFFGYASLPDVTKVTELSCPRFRRG